ncbi:pentatricopeptide repeat-containing protein [Panicum miliaceum]|uniref:Pentatricopeptide repeat-containing protein n=1 Tax=Panicum miliaceum TaxID=4540 RepID=A0A3L6QBS8_PANMI|nr:pentatricopeptide repeat-containing protein [Panicum miliaceum]
MVARAEAGDFAEARSIWAQLLHSSAAPCLPAAAPRLLPAYARLGRFDEILLAVRELSARDPAAARALYPLAVSCLGAAGELARMEDAVLEMGRLGLRVDSATGDAFVRAYAAAGTVPQMEAAYRRHKRTGLLISRGAIRAVASAYISQQKYYKLGALVTDVGLGRRDAGNLLWNLYLLSFAANFKMKSLQRAFLEMVAAGFRPDHTTFNIRAAAFSKMCMFWDLHLSAEHMRRDGVAPDLVTHGCFVDAYLERRLARNLTFAFDRLDGNAEAVVATDGIIFEAFGKGGFHASSEACWRPPARSGGGRTTSCSASTSGSSTGETKSSGTTEADQFSNRTLAVVCVGINIVHTVIKMCLESNSKCEKSFGRIIPRLRSTLKNMDLYSH